MMGTLLQFPERSRESGNGSTQATSGEVVSLPAAKSHNPEREFLVAYHAAMIARAERELIEARWLADHHLKPVGTYSPLWAARGPAFNKMWATVERVAALPAMTQSQLQMKKTAIGNVWLRAEGERYDAYRQSVAADEARLPKKRRR